MREHTFRNPEGQSGPEGGEECVSILLEILKVNQDLKEEKNA
jgi:hypothetical protein